MGNENTWGASFLTPKVLQSTAQGRLRTLGKKAVQGKNTLKGLHKRSKLCNRFAVFSGDDNP